MDHISTTDARSTLSELISRVEFGKETIVLTRRSRDVAAIVPVEALKILTALIDELEDYPEHPDTPEHRRLALQTVRASLGIADRTPDPERGRRLLGGTG